MAHKVFSIFMAMLVMFSTVSLTVEKHYCGDTLVDVAVFEEAKKCGMESSNMPVEEITKKSCCKDTVDCVLSCSSYLNSYVSRQNEFLFKLLIEYVSTHFSMNTFDRVILKLHMGNVKELNEDRFGRSYHVSVPLSMEQFWLIAGPDRQQSNREEVSVFRADSNTKET